MTTPEATLADAVRIHDDDPWRARALLLPLVGQLKDPGDMARLAWLATHVLGGLLKRWPEAATLCAQAVAAAGPPRADLLGRLATSAALAGDILAYAEAETELASILGIPTADATTFIRLLVIEQDLAKDKLGRWLPLFDTALVRAEAIEGPPDLVRLLAITANNSASLILDWCPTATGETARVMERTARLSFRCWHAVGTWLHRERAHYLMALVSNATGQPAAAAKHARQGLALIEANEPEPIDRCFHLLALARAQKALGDSVDSSASLAAAAALATDFDEYWQGEYRKTLAMI